MEGIVELFSYTPFVVLFGVIVGIAVVLVVVDCWYRGGE